jgi:hypothetical protein
MGTAYLTALCVEAAAAGGRNGRDTPANTTGAAGFDSLPQAEDEEDSEYGLDQQEDWN